MSLYTDCARAVVYNLPTCPKCGNVMSRFAWWELPGEDREWWLCCECNKRLPLSDRSCVYTLPKRKPVPERIPHGN